MVATMTNRKRTRPESLDQARVRLAAEAKERGVQLFTHGREWFATSSSNPGTLHRVTLLSCDCAGFCHHGRCTHNSLLLDAFGELPQVEPAPMPVRCANCGGGGFVYYSHGDNAPCRSCGATGWVDAPEPAPDCALCGDAGYIDHGIGPDGVEPCRCSNFVKLVDHAGRWFLTEVTNLAAD